MATPHTNHIFAKDTEIINTNELLVKYSADYRSLASERSLEGIEEIEVIAPQVELLTFENHINLEQVKRALESDPAVDYVEPNYERQLFSIVNDPYYSNQWWIPHVKAERIWMYIGTQREKIVVAVIDSGIDMTHEDLKGRIEPDGYNFHANNTIVTDRNGHGTSVAGVIAAESGNSRGGAGIAGPYDVSILPLKISDTSNNSKVSDSIKAIDYAIERKVSVINMSLGGPGFSKLENEAVQRAVDAGIIVVAAVGNSALTGNSIFYPASYEQVISVGAVDKSNLRASFSNYNSYVDLVAPGVAIYTTSLNDSYRQVSGTSFSTPIVAGTVAMMKGLKPNLSNSEITELLTSTAKDLGVPGRDDHYGAGVLDVGQLVVALNLGFQGDFPEMTVLDSKVFTVTFNEELDPKQDYHRNILLIREAAGATTFTVEIDPTEPNKLLIRPTTKWALGTHYLTVKAGTKNKNNKALKKDVRMKFEVVGES